jgi:hypothetical protein
LAIPAEIGALIRHYIERAQLKPDGKLFEFSHSAPSYVSKAISKAILCFSPPDYQAAVARGEAALPTITPTDLRHNVGHSLAMQGAAPRKLRIFWDIPHLLLPSITFWRRLHWH